MSQDDARVVAEVRSFDIEGCRGQCYGGYRMKECKPGEYTHGDYVLYDDYETMRAQRDALQSRLDAVGALADKWEEFDRRKGSPAVHSAAAQLRAALGGESRGNEEVRK